MCAFCIPAASAERLLCAVPKTPAKSSVPPRLPLHKNRPLLTRSESTLPHLLIPRHFNSPGINTYKKPGRGSPSATRKFYNSSPRTVANTADPLQRTENTAALYPASANLDAASSLTPLFATLTENTRGGGTFRQANSRRTSRGFVYQPVPGAQVLLEFQPSTFNSQRVSAYSAPPRYPFPFFRLSTVSTLLHPKGGHPTPTCQKC
jgi:hypothetical protein